MNNNYPLVSIITPTYNRASFLEETIQSILSQDYPNIEYIVLDDGSTDNTQEILKKYNKSIIWESHANMGETLTVNKGFSISKGEVICVINSDDPIYPGAIRTAINYLQDHPNVLAAYPDWDEIGPQSEFIRHNYLPEYNIKNMLVDFNVSLGPGVFFRRDVFNLVGMRDPSRKFTGDLEFWFRIAQLRPDALGHIPSILATHRTHPCSASSSAKSEEMATEVVTLVENVLKNPAIDSDIKRLKRIIMGNAHFSALCYCGSKIGLKIKHYCYAIYYNPIKLVYCPLLIASFIKQYLLVFIQGKKR